MDLPPIENNNLVILEEAKRRSKKIEHGDLDVIAAHELPTEYQPPDELLEGILTNSATSVLYGDSNCGKTFLAIDMSCAIARGVNWMTRRTDQGMVVYIAAESPGSVGRRLQVYQRYHNVRINNLFIVQSSINLYDNEADTQAIIQLVHRLEQEHQQHVRLIVGDTLARLSAGANENSGEHMGVVIRHTDRIVQQCKSHFLLVHHNGKNAAAGQRGWSGVRAAIDTEIEVTDTAEGRCAEITKQRDLDSNKERIGFKLESIVMGKTKWGKDATGCVVLSNDAPAKQSPSKQARKRSPIGDSIITYLAQYDYPVDKTSTVNVVARIIAKLKKKEVDKNLTSSVYRKLKELVDDKQVIESNGFLKVAELGADRCG